MLAERLRRSAVAAAVLIGVIGLGRAHADDAPAAAGEPTLSNLAIHVQATFVDQAHDTFPAPYSGPNSLSPQTGGRETFDLTLFLGMRLWSGAEVWIDPELDQGFGLSNTLGVAGFPSGEAYKVGKAAPYLRMQRLFLRQTIGLSGKTSDVEADQNQFAGTKKDDRIVVTVGKFAVTDVFDTNDYAHDPKRDFLNWAILDTGTFDYAADAWGYTVGGAAELDQGPWTLRGGVFDLSQVPNSTRLDPNFAQFQLEGEIERHYTIAGRDGAVKLTAFLSRGRMANFADALALAAETGATPKVADVRRYQGRGGVSLDGQQKITDDLAAFLRAGWANGDIEPYEFADIDRTLAAGLSLNGKRWGAPKDAIGVAGVVNGISSVHEAYFAAGGLGILIGDGRLPHPGPEEIAETYYDHALSSWTHVSVDCQFVNHPAYNRDRGPVAIVAARLHAQF